MKITKKDEKKILTCVHCGSDKLEKIIPVKTLIGSEKVLFECKTCKERQYSDDKN